MQTKSNPPTEASPSARDNPCYGTEAAIATLNVMADDGTSSQLPYAQFLFSRLSANPVLEREPDAPPQQLLICFAVAEVLVLGCGLKSLERAIQRQELRFVQRADRRYLATLKTHVASVGITFIQQSA
jgi:hypothetical protein